LKIVTKSGVKSHLSMLIKTKTDLLKIISEEITHLPLATLLLKLLSAGGVVLGLALPLGFSLALPVLLRHAPLFVHLLANLEKHIELLRYTRLRIFFTPIFEFAPFL
jgi:hypothetical protein